MRTLLSGMRLALETVWAHKLRSFLTLLGVVISTTTLIVVMSVVNGMNYYIAEHIENWSYLKFPYAKQWGDGSMSGAVSAQAAVRALFVGWSKPTTTPRPA